MNAIYYNVFSWHQMAAFPRSFPHKFSFVLLVYQICHRNMIEVVVVVVDVRGVDGDDVQDDDDVIATWAVGVVFPHFVVQPIQGVDSAPSYDILGSMDVLPALDIPHGVGADDGRVEHLHMPLGSPEVDN